jgi:1-acyl-sn-glycerol-3-phosphate acyltransferase
VSGPATVDGATPQARSWLADAWYDTAYWACAFGLTLGFSLRTEGSRHVPRRGPALVIANHLSYLDPPLVGVAARRPLCALARKSLYRHAAFAWLLRSLHAVPIDQEGTGIEGLRVVLRLLQAGEAVLVFPEGHRSRDGAMRPLEAGVHLLIKRTKAPIIPVGIAGAYDAWPPGVNVPVPAPLFLPATARTVAVSIGAPLDARRYANMPRESALEELAGELRRAADRAERLRRKPWA